MSENNMKNRVPEEKLEDISGGGFWSNVESKIKSTGSIAKPVKEILNTEKQNQLTASLNTSESKSIGVEPYSTWEVIPTSGNE